MNNKKNVFIAFIVSLGGFLFGFDAAIIAGVIGSVEKLFRLSPLQVGWVVSSPTFSAMIAMIFAGALGNKLGRKRILIFVAILYVISAIGSAMAGSYESLYVMRMIGGLAFGAALILAPMYIAEITHAENRGKMVSIQQLNIVIGFSVAYFVGYFLNEYSQRDLNWLNEENAWRWMLGVESVPAILYFIFLFKIPYSPRWLMLKNKLSEAKSILTDLYGPKYAENEVMSIAKSMSTKNYKKAPFLDLLKPNLRFGLLLGLLIGVLQQITGINAIFFYSTSIFEQTGIGSNAAFAQSVIVGLINVAVTILVMFLIDKIGRRPLVLIGCLGIAISMFTVSYGFKQSTYQLTPDSIARMDTALKQEIGSLVNVEFDNDLEFNKALIDKLGTDQFRENKAQLIQAGAHLNAYIILIGILGFVASFAFSVGPVMWVLLTELFPNYIRSIAIGFIGFVNSFVSWGVQQIFPWEVATLGNSLTFLLFGLFSLIGFVLMYRYLPETKGKSLEELEGNLAK